MSDNIDTSADAVRALVAEANNGSVYYLRVGMPEKAKRYDAFAATLSALLERCEKAEAERANTTSQLHVLEGQAAKARFDRDESEAAEHRAWTEVDKLNAYIKKMDGILEEVGGITVSCINPYEDLKCSLTALKSERDDLRARLGESETYAAKQEKLAIEFSTKFDTAQQQLAAAQARVAELEERLHYCNGTSELALKHRDEAEAREKALREALEKVPPAWIGYADWRESWTALAGSAQPSAGEDDRTEMFSGVGAFEYQALHDALVLAAGNYALTVPDSAKRDSDTKSGIYQFVEETPATSMVVELVDALHTLGKRITLRAQPSAPEGGKGGGE
jgi:uncharacterized coiled-coil protein SlyX